MLPTMYIGNNDTLETPSTLIDIDAYMDKSLLWAL